MQPILRRFWDKSVHLEYVLGRNLCQSNRSASTFQTCGDSLVCGNWFFHMTGFYTVALSAVYGISVYCLSEYSDAAFLDIIIDNKPYTAALYPWQVSG